MARVAVRRREGSILCSKSAFEVELRGFEPLTLSMRTPGGEVARGRWGRSAVDRSLWESLAVDGVAVLVRCTASGPAGEAVSLELPLFRLSGHPVAPSTTNYDVMSGRVDCGR
jgi:hypothetical protein